MSHKLKTVCFGEVLWDIFPDHKKIGGAPLNVAIRLNSLNNDSYMISRVGNDNNGAILTDFVKKSGVSTDYIQRDSILHTGEVTIELDDKGAATYDIMFPRAWDKIECNEKIINLVKESDAFIYGSLAARDEVSKNSLFQLIDYANYKIFDINLRPPYYSKELLIQLMNTSDFIKFNDDELFEISKYLGSKYHSLEQNISYVSKKTATNHICVTKGSHGAVLLYNDTFYYNSGYQIKVKDTVGAGDSFLASLISHLLKRVHPQEAIDFACAVGALVVGREGATPTVSAKEISEFMNPD
jgi:fructokinase